MNECISFGTYTAIISFIFTAIIVGVFVFSLMYNNWRKGTEAKKNG